MTRTRILMAHEADDHKQKLVDNFNALQTIDAYSHACLATKLVKIPGAGEPEWQKSFNAHLDVLKGHATTWVDTLGPEIGAKVPQTILDFDHLFVPAMKAIKDIVDKVVDKATPEDVQKLRQLIEAQMFLLRQQKTKVTDLKTRLQTFADDVQKDHATLVDGANGAVNALQMDEILVKQFTASIARLQAQIDAQQKAATVGMVAGGLGMVVIVAAFLVAAAASGGSLLPLVVGGAGVLIAGGGFVAGGIYTHGWNKDWDELQDLQRKLSATQSQAAVLRGVTETLGGLVTKSTAALESLSTVQTMWSTLEAKYQGVLDRLKDAQPQDVVTIVNEIEVDASLLAWADLVDFAKKVQSLKVEVQVVPHESAAAFLGISA